VKNAVCYVANADNLGGYKMGPANSNAIFQSFTTSSGAILEFGAPVALLLNCTSPVGLDRSSLGTQYYDGELRGKYRDCPDSRTVSLGIDLPGPELQFTPRQPKGR
jgi:hypothetical protein